MKNEDPAVILLHLINMNDTIDATSCSGALHVEKADSPVEEG